jgi:hypothetical protein
METMKKNDEKYKNKGNFFIIRVKRRPERAKLQKGA